MQLHGPDRIFPPATGIISARRNLLSHLVRLAEFRLAQTHPVGGESDPFGQGDAYINAIQHLAELLDPDFKPGVLSTPESMRAILNRVGELWTEVVISEADPVGAQKACDYAQKLLSRFPAATASYVNECAGAFTEPQAALDMLAQASRFIQTPEDAFRVDRAQKHAVQVILLRKMPIPPETIPPAPPLPPAISAGSTGEPLLTESHRTALRQLVEIGGLFFNRPFASSQVALRLSVLLAGPTGSGKSFLTRRAAARLGAYYLKVTRGDWCPRGAKSGRPTTFVILDHLVKGDRVALVLDEADKLTLDHAKEWSAGLASDIWNVLDGHFPVEDYLRETKFDDVREPSASELENKIKTKLWIIGAGTWQHVFARGGKPSMGFFSSKADATITQDDIRRSEMISPELLLRFNSDLIFLDYPTREETPHLLRCAGITGLAEELGITLSPDDVDWQRGGMRVLETLATRLTLEKYRQSRKNMRNAEV
jgi:hypothetical protein